MKKQNKLVIAAIGFLVILLTVVGFFLLNITKDALHYWALTFLLFAQIMFFGGLVTINSLSERHNALFSKIGITVTLSLYLFVVIISLFFTNNFSKNLNGFIFMELLFVILLAVLILVTTIVSKNIANNDQATFAKQVFISTCEIRINNLLIANKEYEKGLKKLYEDIKFSDKVGITSIDETVGDQITQLEKDLQLKEKSNEEINQQIQTLIILIKQRNEEMKIQKRGKF